jgi:hypothetical protein
MSSEEIGGLDKRVNMQNMLPWRDEETLVHYIAMVPKGVIL